MLRYLLLPLLLVSTSLAADTALVPGYYHGKIGDHLVVDMLLTRNGENGSISGQYRYEKYGQPICLIQQDDPKWPLRLKEQDPRAADSDAGGTFRGSVDSENQFQGHWVSADGKRKLVCQLTRIANIEEFTNHTPRYTVHRAIPHFLDGTPFHTALAKLLSDQAQKETQTVSADFEQATSDPIAGRAAWENDGSVEILYADDKMVSLCTRTYEYAGGAHGNTSYTATTYAWRNEKLEQLNTADMVSDKAARIICPMLVRSLKRQHAAWAENAEKLRIADWTVNPTSQGLVFTIAPYEVDCYAAGTYTVMLPYSTITSAIPYESPLRPYADRAIAGQTAVTVTDP